MYESTKEAIKLAIKQLINENDPQFYAAYDFVDKFFSCGEAFSKLSPNAQRIVMNCFTTIAVGSMPFVFNPNGNI